MAAGSKPKYSSAERTGYTTPIDLATYEYEGNVYNGRLSTMAYGNGDFVDNAIEVCGTGSTENPAQRSSVG